MLKLERPWTRQPQGAIGINWSNPLLSRVALFMPFNGNAVDLVSGKFATIGSGASTVVDKMGLALYGSGSAAVASIPVNLSDTPLVSVSFWLDWPTYATDYDMALEYTADGGSNAGFFITPNHPSSVIGTTSRGGSGGTTANFSRPTAGLHHYVLNINRNISGATGSLKLFVDGVAQSPVFTDGAGHTGNFANSTLFILNRNNSSLYGNGSIRNLVLRKRLLADHEARSEYLYPWQLFAPQQIYIPTAAAASSLPTLSASTYVPGSLTSTGWRPQITAS